MSGCTALQSSASGSQGVAIDSNVSRRSALTLLAAGAAGWALWPYAPRSRRDIPQGRKVVTYWEKWTGPEGDAIQQVVDDFNASQSRLWVHRVPVNDQDSKALVAIGGGDPPDIAGLYSYSVPQYAETGAAIPLADLGFKPDPSAYAPGVWQMLTHQGRQWAGVNTCYTIALYYNRAHFREAGLDPDKPPRTIDQFNDVAQRLTIKGPAGEITRAGFVHTLPWWWPYMWPSLFGADLYDAANNRSLFDSPACVRAFEWIGSWPARLGREALATYISAFGRSFNGAEDPFLTGRVSMAATGPWIANFARTYAPNLDYAAVPLPVSSEIFDAARPIGLLECDVLMIPRGSPNPEAAMEFLLYTQQPRVQEQLATAHCKSSPMTAVSPQFMSTHPNRAVAVHDQVAKSSRSVVLPRCRSWKQYAILTQRAFDNVWLGADAKAELAAVNSRVQSLLDREADLRQRRGGRHT